MEGDRIEDVTLAHSTVDEISHLALDIGGSLIKMVYFSTSREQPVDKTQKNSSRDSHGVSRGSKDGRLLNGRLYFIKFETSKINECLDFISSKQLHHRGLQHHAFPASDKNVIKATGGGAFKFADLFKEKLGISLDKVEEMSSLVSGANFLLKAVPSEAFTYVNGQRNYVQIDHNDLYPYLLVNIGSGVSMIKVDGDGKYERVSGTSVDESSGNNRVIDMLVGDIYGGMDYLKIGLSSTAIASSFGKAVSENRELEDYKPEDVARSLLRMISNNIGQIAYLNALRFGLKKIFFGGFFIRGHAYTMDTISVAVDFWSKGEAKAMFLRHEGFLGALGAFTNYQVVEEFPDSIRLVGEKTRDPLDGDLTDNGVIECCVQASN
ncbi:hypothetical protein OSB04_018357 [Centaurea solstitialis]|uniref:Pantothenate kinase n=1 Tax=Centaurea solstitialis TaxID=347529 RepID=A0AA38WBG8_9ASTR|nr:hypothetical protein OSB04_018357 [Centaurea solstitialis]